MCFICYVTFEQFSDGKISVVCKNNIQIKRMQQLLIFVRFGGSHCAVCCPSSPRIGWQFLKMVANLVTLTVDHQRLQRRS